VSNHPNRGPKGPSANPAPADIVAGREATGLTQTQAACLVHASLRAWQQWESGDRRMHAGLWELFVIKAALIERHSK
jgi:putative transcriptional regulator